MRPDSDQMQPDGNQHSTSRARRMRLTVQQAAERLGVSVEAVRGRIKRGSLDHEKATDGSVYVLLDADRLQQDDDQLNDQTLLVTRLENEVEFLRRELERRDHLLAAALERIPPAIEAPSDERGSPQAAPQERGGSDTPSDQERPSWWRRFFGL